MKAFSDQRPPSDAAQLICTSKTNTFSFVIQPHLLLEKSRQETRHFTEYIPFLRLCDPHNCKHMKEVTGKKKRDHLCTFTKHLFHLNFTAYVCYYKSPLTVPDNNWWLYGEELLSALAQTKQNKTKHIKSTEIK